MLWLKAFHIVFVVSWFSGMFYLPRIFVNLAMEQEREHGGGVTTERLLLMARKLYRFMMMLSVPAVLLGLWLAWMQYGFKLPGWLHAKLALVFLAIGYSHACGGVLKKFERGVNQRSHTWFRWFNEAPVFLLVAIVILVVVKPF
ncbi:CopD family protein [Pseudoduganella namucuonensis]|uniref:Protoporphyrinogen IX oxidase n=1 Tax=Pseudoduganella namucuonensis TaxID=1035707 RepID=A0A1I7M103_9BURK|nr:CopD family protein [Pseudoduganella namucuonensis]SFV15651.1 putative membrane protein [Pseudoduganella namucuonensis]